MFDERKLNPLKGLYEEIKGLSLEEFMQKKPAIKIDFPARLVTSALEDKVKTKVLIIDPQNDFAATGGALYVKGASRDMERALKFLCSILGVISELHISADNHQPGSIFFPERHIKPDGSNPEPFSKVTADNYLYDHWSSSAKFGGNVEELNRLTIHYCLEAAKKGIPLQLWPHHCMQGTAGSKLVDPIAIFRNLFQTYRRCPPNVFTKGESKNTEYYSAFGPVVEKDYDNRPLAKAPAVTPNNFANADIIILMGEALSHCVGQTLNDLVAAGLGKKIYLVRDCTSNVPGFEAQGEEFANTLKAHDGHIVQSTTPFLHWPGVREIFEEKR